MFSRQELIWFESWCGLSLVTCNKLVNDYKIEAHTNKTMNTVMFIIYSIYFFFEKERKKQIYALSVNYLISFSISTLVRNLNSFGNDKL